MRRAPAVVALSIVLSAAASVPLRAQVEPVWVSPATTHRALFKPGDPVLDRLTAAGAVLQAEDHDSFVFAVIDEAKAGGRASLLALGLEFRDEDAVIGFNGAPLDTADRAGLDAVLNAIPPALRARDVPADEPFWGRELMIVQFQGPIRDAWLDRLKETGARIVEYVASNAYVVSVEGPARASLDEFRHDRSVQWIGAYHPWLRLAPGLRDRAVNGTGVTEVVVQVLAEEGAVELVTEMIARRLELLRPPAPVAQYLNLTLRAPDRVLADLARNPWVFGIEAWYPERLLDEAQGQIMAGNLNAGGTGPSAPGYLAWLAGKGFTGTGQFAFAVDVVDDGVDRGSTTDINVEFRAGGVVSGASRLVYNNNYTSDALADGGGGHGNLNASIIGGYNGLTGAAYEDAGGYNYGLGIAPFVQIGNSKVFANSGAGQFNQSTATRLANAYNGGARFSSNSWGQTSGNNYTSDAQAHDNAVRDALTGTSLNQELSIIFAAGNSGSGANTVRPPATAKNIITVAAGENQRQTGTDGCGIGNTGADNVKDIISFSSRGPCSDARKKPDIAAPGTHIEGAASRSTNYNGSGVCNQYWPAGQTLYAWSSGTSHSCPATAGAAALTRQYFVNQGFGTPSPAMVKNWLMTTATHMTGVGANDTLWSNSQGMGRVDLGRAFGGTASVRVDQTQILGATGNTYTTSGSISSSSQPFRVGLVWTDKSGPTTGNAYVNNLDLEVTVNGTLYRGNVFSGAGSIAGGTADVRNNGEFVFLAAGTTGSYSIVVRATNIAGDGVPGNADTTDQDFALVVHNGSAGAPTPDFALAVTPSSRTITQGTSTTYTVSNTASGGFASTIALSAAPAISGVSYSFSPNPMSANGSSTLTVTTTAAATTGTHTVTITGTGGGLTRTTSCTLVVNPSGGGSGDAVKTYSASPAAAIPDNNATGVTSSIAVTHSMTVTSVSVSPNITHTYKGDLVVTVISPAGTQVILHNRSGGSTDNVITTFAIVTAPAQALTAFNGQSTSGTWQCKVQDLASVDTGTFNSWSITFNGEKAVSPNLAIPDNNTTGITSTQNYTATGTVASVKVKVGITHTYKGDLEVALIGPDGTTVLLHNRTGGSTDNINTVFPDLTAPAASLSAFTGRSIAGNWSLRVRDLAAADLGTLNSWTLCLSAQ